MARRKKKEEQYEKTIHIVGKEIPVEEPVAEAAQEEQVTPEVQADAEVQSKDDEGGEEPPRTVIYC